MPLIIIAESDDFENCRRLKNIISREHLIQLFAMSDIEREIVEKLDSISNYRA